MIFWEPMRFFCGISYSFRFGPYVASIIGQALMLAALVSLAWIAARVLFALAAYNDAQAHVNPDALMWSLLIGFLGLIPGIIYLCIRGSQQRKVCCLKCGFWHSAWEPNCPRCGAPSENVQQEPSTAYTTVYAAKAKKFLVAALICLGIMIVAAIVGGIAIGASAAINALNF